MRESNLFLFSIGVIVSLSVFIRELSYKSLIFYIVTDQYFRFSWSKNWQFIAAKQFCLRFRVRRIVHIWDLYGSLRLVFLVSDYVLICHASICAHVVSLRVPIWYTITLHFLFYHTSFDQNFLNRFNLWSTFHLLRIWWCLVFKRLKLNSPSFPTSASETDDDWFSELAN